MHDPEGQLRLSVRRKIEIGRVTIYAVSGAVTHGAPMDDAAALGRSRQDPPYLLVLPKRGGLRYIHHGRAERIADGDYVLLSQRAFFELEIDRGCEALIANIPAADLKGRMASVEDHAGRRFKSNERLSRLLVDLLRGVTEEFADGAPPNPEALATEIVGFVALTLGAEDRSSVIDVRNGRYQLRRRIFEFIETQLGDPNLSPKKIAASSRISLSYLYSLFNDDDTTVGQFVQTKRLQRAYEILVADHAGRRTVAEVAYEVGFKNVSHFSRSFSRRFSVAPRDVRHALRLPDEAPSRLTPEDRNAGARPRISSPLWRPERPRAAAHS